MLCRYEATTTTNVKVAYTSLKVTRRQGINDNLFTLFVLSLIIIYIIIISSSS